MTIKWSAFPTTATPTTGDVLVGLHAGSNYQFTGVVVPFSLAVGGTGAALTASSGGIVYSGLSSFAVLAGTATANQILMSGSSAAPAWSTATYPATTTVNQLLYSSSSNIISGLATVSNGVLITGASGIPNLLANGTPGYVLTANSGAPPSWQSISGAGAITTINGDSGSAIPSAGVVTISGGGIGLTTSGSSATLSLTGTLNLTHGGTGANLTASNGGIFYCTATTADILNGTNTANRVLLSGSNTTPSWSTATYPAATTISEILYSSSNNVIGGLATTPNGVLITNNGGIPSMLTNSVTAGFVLTANTAAPPSWSSLATLGGITSIAGNSGSATPSSGVVTMTGGTTGLTTSASGSTIALAGTLNLASGGTNASLVASNGGIFYSTGSAGAILSGTGTAGQVLLSGANTTPAWSSATYPATTTTSQLLYSSSSNVVAGLAIANSACLVSNSSGVPVWSSTMTNGQIIIGSTSATPSAATITAGNGVTITNGAGSITIATSGGGLTWANISGTTQAAAVNTGYTASNASQTTITLPATYAVGEVVAVEGIGAGGWILAANTGDTIQMGTFVTSSGGNLTSAVSTDNVYVTAIVANTTWRVRTTNSQGLTYN